MMSVGCALLLACVPALAIGNSQIANVIVVTAVTVGGALVLSALTALQVMRRPSLFPNERAHTAERSRVAGWLFSVVATLLVMPGWMSVRLEAFFVEWKQVFDLLAASRFWEGPQAMGSGLIVIPIAGALTPPFLELLTAGAFIIAVVLVVPLFARSVYLPRVYVATVVLLTGLVLASAGAAQTALGASGAAETLIASSNPRPEEAAQMREWLGRYTSHVSTASHVLLWTLLPYVVWIPAMLRARRTRTTFVRTMDASAPGESEDLDRITRPPSFPA